jgi:hypothetical protein
MQRTSEFYGPIDGHIVIPAPHCGPGGLMNFNFGGYLPADSKSITAKSGISIANTQI